MASKGDDDVTNDELAKAFSNFVRIADRNTKDDTKFNSKACNKLVKDCLADEYGKYDVGNRADSSVFSKLKEGNAMKVTGKNCETFCHRLGHEMAKKTTKNDKLPENDPEVTKCEKNIRKKICAKGPVLHGTKTSKTGGVEKMTDTSQFTGSHKERFNKDGTGKGIDGREDRHKNDGYVEGFQRKK